MKEVSIIGAGFVGVAHAAFLSKFYTRVNLIDKNDELIRYLNGGKLPFTSSDTNLSSIFAKEVANEVINPTSDLQQMTASSSIFISISFDFSSGENDYTNLIVLFEKICYFARSEALIVLETTVPPGTSDKIILPVLLKENEKKSLRYVYSYERVMPGPNYLDSVEKLPKVYGALDDSSNQRYLEHLDKVYSSGEHVRLTNLISAETAKVFENTYRMINIALVQEFTEFSEFVGANTPDILDCIRSRSTHNNIRYSGLAPGGYCLTKDPSFLMKSSELFEFKHELPILTASIKTTEKQNGRVLDFLKEKLDINSNYQFLGISYLSGVGDVRGSSSLLTYKKLYEMGYKINAIDNYCQKFTSQVPGNLLEVRENFSGCKVILATRHPEINSKILSQCVEIIDINSCLTKLEKTSLRDMGVRIMQYGENL